MRVMYKGKLWNKEEIQALLDRNDVAVVRALLTIYQNQTEDEKAVGATRHWNSIGFTGADDMFLSSVAEKVQQYGRFASEKQLNAVRKSIKKYWKQLLQEIAQKQGAEVIKGRISNRKDQI